MASVTVCVSATSTEGLTTTTAFRQWLGSTATSDDSAQQWSILRASSWAESQLGYPAAVQVYSEIVPAFGTRELLLSRVPVRRVLRVFDSTTTSGANSYTSSEYRIEDADAGILTRDQGYAWTAFSYVGASDTVIPGSERRPWLVEYVAGWGGAAGATATCISTSTGAMLPYAVEQAVLLKAREFYQADGNVVSKKIGDLSITYATLGSGRPVDPALEALRPFLRMYL